LLVRYCASRAWILRVRATKLPNLRLAPRFLKVRSMATV
jgi:hypothetical protein